MHVTIFPVYTVAQKHGKSGGYNCKLTAIRQQFEISTALRLVYISRIWSIERRRFQ